MLTRFGWPGKAGKPGTAVCIPWAIALVAIFLSTFVMIGQNRQAAFQQDKADHDFQTQELELKTNTELTRQIHVLTTELHRRLIGPQAANGQSPPAT